MVAQAERHGQADRPAGRGTRGVRQACVQQPLAGRERVLRRRGLQVGGFEPAAHASEVGRGPVRGRDLRDAAAVLAPAALEGFAGAGGVQPLRGEGSGGPALAQLLQRDHRRSHGAGKLGAGVEQDVAAEQRLEPGVYGRVPGHPALEDDAATDGRRPDDFLEVVLRDGVGQPRAQVVAMCAVLQVMHEIRIHEDGAAAAERGRGPGPEGRFGELLRDAYPEPRGLLFEKGAGAGGAGPVHAEGFDLSIFHAQELGILTADLKDRVDLREEKCGRGRLRRNLVDRAPAEQNPGQVPPRPRRHHVRDPAVSGQPRPQLPDDLADRRLRVPGRGTVG